MRDFRHRTTSYFLHTATSQPQRSHPPATLPVPHPFFPNKPSQSYPKNPISTPVMSCAPEPPAQPAPQRPQPPGLKTGDESPHFRSAPPQKPLLPMRSPKTLTWICLGLSHTRQDLARLEIVLPWKISTNVLTNWVHP